MNEQAYKIILDHFCERRRLSSEHIPSGAKDMICAISAPYLLMIECLDQLDPNGNTEGILVKLIDRAYETAAASLGLISIGHFREAEILSRSVLESSANIAFIAQKDTPARVGQFFYDYIHQEAKQNQKWKNDLDGISEELKKDHINRIEQKYKALETYERFINAYLQGCGLDAQLEKSWPNLPDRLSALGRRIDYRTIYSAMCSQAHHDAEDILNNFIVNGIEDLYKFAPQMEHEANTFSVFMVLFGLEWFVETTLSVCASLNFPTVTEEAHISLERIRQELEMIAHHLDKAKVPETWF